MSKKVAYFIGIGGAGMSSIARYLNKTGWNVSGYDKTETPLTDQLRQEGININFDICDSSIPEEIKNVDLLLVTTPAISSDHPHLVALKKLGHKAIKRAELLGEITKSKTTLAISGTHGKTSTTALLAHIIDGTPQRCNAFIGGISAETNSNLYYSPNATWNIVEADEFDRSFHHLLPTHAAISSIDPDHLDVYGSESNFIEAFKIFASQVKEKVVIHSSIATTFNNLQNIETYGLEDCSLTHYATDISQTSSGSSFTLSLGNGKLVIPQVRVDLMGKHNLENIVAAAALAYLAGAKKEVIKIHLDQKNLLDKDIQSKKVTMEKEIENEILKAQKEMDQLKKSSLSDIRSISENIASSIIENISGDKLNESSIKAAVEDVSKKNIGKYL